ncbi:histidine phosphatase family protein [Gammaproteobacteria bacterium]|nr:histidine phosphatase family protein [Gammaproteobacteria bacterium]
MDNIKIALGAFTLLLASSSVNAQEAVFVIRHAEQELTGLVDAGLRQEGLERATDWATILRPSGLDLVVTTEIQRSRATGAIIAEALGVPRVEFSKGASSSIAEFLRENYPEDVVLVVGHSETIPKLLRSLGYSDTFPISKSAYGWLFIVTPLENGPPAVARLNIDLR